MASSVLHQDMPLRDHFQPDPTYTMSPSSNTSSPVFRPVSYNSPRSITEQKRRTSSVSSSTSPERRPSIPMERRSTVHFDDEPLEKPAVEPTAPAPTQSSLEIYDTRELTAVDKKWGRLFDIDNQPTERFREAMHSLSRYIVRAFPTSTENIVLVPAKLASFYNFHGVEGDPFSYKVIFSSSDRDLNLNRRIADLYQDLGCSYHLVQASPGVQPRIPGLTPDGFTRWMALHLQAFPDGVFQRLDRVISDFPLDAVSPLDGRTERLPKQLSRYLLPRVPDTQIRSLLQQAVKRHFGEAALLSFSFPGDKIRRVVRPAPRSTQSCPSSPSHRSFPSPSASTPAVIQASHRDGRAPEHIHRASDPGTMPYHAADDKDKMAPPAHRRHASYPGSQSKSRRSSEVVTSHHHRERERAERAERRERGERERDREERHHRSPSRPPSSRRSSMPRHNSPAPLATASTERKEDVRRSSHHRRLALREVEHHRSSSRDSSNRDTSIRDRDSRRRSSSRSSHSGIVGSSQDSTTGSSSDSRRSKYPPSPLSTVQVHSSTTPPAATTKTKSATPATNSSARRAPSPIRSKSSSHNTFRSSLPEIHHTDRSDRADRADSDRRRQSFMGTPTPRETGLARDAMEHSAEVKRRASYYRPPPSTAETRASRDRDHLHTHRMERKASSGEEHNYRLYGSLASRETAAKPSPMPAPKNTDISPRVSLAATVTTLEDELALHKDDDGTESDQTWDDYLRSSPRMALA